ncbi:AEC family transporter [Porcincola intestinalis]|uniref:AEC family transporter n=1 Tax=Porcincola intestinalis TaxID=2606632 RepID=UPI002A90E26C|nr:AEC family transporter [Porcincola intestinalis]MDY5579651.1 AEC family transporter [Porcincola intestinalis]
MENLIFSINATLPIFLLMVLGYVLSLLKLVSRDFAKQLNSFVFKIALPFELFVDMAGQDFASAWNGKFVLFCLAATFLSICLAALISRIVLRNDRAERGEFIQVAYRSSAAILGVAFIQNIYGEGHTAMAALMMIGSVPLYNIFAVIVLMTTAQDAQQQSADRQSLVRKTVLGIVTNPILLGIFIGFAWSLLRLPLPGIPKKVISDVGKVATPLGLIAMGAMFDPAAARKKAGPAIVASLMKLLVLEAVFLPAAVAFGFRGQQLVALTVMLGSASTVACYVMATSMGHEGTLTSSTVMMTTAGCSFSLALWLYILKSLALI